MKPTECLRILVNEMAKIGPFFLLTAVQEGFFGRCSYDDSEINSFGYKQPNSSHAANGSEEI